MYSDIIVKPLLTEKMAILEERENKYAFIVNINANKINPFFSQTETQAETYLRSSINNHYWYGGLSTIDYSINNFLSISIADLIAIRIRSASTLSLIHI